MRVNLCLMLMLALTTGVLMIFLKLFAWKKD